jgi:uncharacterized protein YqeY
MSEEPILKSIEKDLTAAMKAQDADTLSTLRMLKTAIMDAKTRKPKDQVMTREEEIEILQRYVKKRRETIEELRKVNRADLVPKEELEIRITQRYLPAAVSEDELRRLVAEAVTKTGAAGLKDMGKVIGMVMGQVKGKAEGAVVSKLVKEALGG